MPKLAKASDGKLEGLTFPRLAASCPGSSIRPVKSGRDPQDGDIMKNCKKLGALLLALTMVITSGIMSFADGDAAAPAVGTTTETAVETTTEPAGETTTEPAAAAETTPEPASDGEQTESQDSTGTDDTGAGEVNEYAHDRRCTTCYGAKTVKEKSPCSQCGDEPNADCEECKGTGSVMKTVPCSTCEGTGKIPCPAQFGEGALNSINDDGTGIVKHTCQSCWVFTYETPMSAEDVAEELAKKITVKYVKLYDSRGVENSSREKPGKIVKFRVEIGNNSYTTLDTNVSLTVALDEGLKFVKTSSGTPIEDESGNVIIQASIQGGKSKSIYISVQMPDDKTKIGTEFAIALDKVTVSNAGNEAEVTLPKNKSKSVCLREYFVNETGLTGLNMGYYYGGNDSDKTNSKKIIKPLDLNELEEFEGKVLSFEGLGSLVKFPYKGNEVINKATQRKWQCVGFIPVHDNYSAPDLNKIKQYVFSNTKKLGFKVKESIEDAKTYVSNEGGILYGDPVDKAALDRWEEKASKFTNNIYFQAVWYVTDNSIADEDIGKLTPSQINPIKLDEKYAEKPNDTDKGITVACTDPMVWDLDTGHPYYTANLIVTISKNSTEDAHINLSEALADAAKAFDENPRRAFQPGDTIYYTLTIVNESGKKYTYVPGSGVIATKEAIATKPDDMPKDGETVDMKKYAGIGFDGFYLSKYSKTDFSAYPRRTNNAPLKELFLNDRWISLNDGSIGAKLRALGYGTADITNEEITQNYLGSYYLDWTNSIRASKGETPATSFQELSIEELSVFTNGDTGVVTQETCQTVAEALYYFYYGKALSFKLDDKKGMSLYDHMVRCEGGISDLEEVIPAVLKGENDKCVITVSAAGEEVNNAFQNTKFGFRIEFDLKASDPDPTPTPTPTPDPTPEPEPTPEPQPLPPDDPLEEPDPTPDPQPLPPDDPLEEPEEDVPAVEPENPDQPKTGDQSDLALWLGVMILASGAVVTMRLKKRKED